MDLVENSYVRKPKNMVGLAERNFRRIEMSWKMFLSKTNVVENVFVENLTSSNECRNQAIFDETDFELNKSFPLNGG